ncbi:hypothetical protein HY485_05330 [Candidatus Woesearchaeota archaeon]|nr:hypothetical protein [Candidatus Woesearchaeota archaeon]
MNKRAVELTMNVIIIAAILLITLAVLLSFYINQTKKVETAFNQCESKRGECMSADNCKQQKGTPLPFSCTTETYTCCLVIK